MRLPLQNLNVWVTRSEARGSELSQQLHDAGAECHCIETIEIAPPESYGLLDSAMKTLANFDWVVFTSVNGITSFQERREVLGLGSEAVSSRKFAVVGQSTAAKFRTAFGREPDFIPSAANAEAIGRELPVLSGERILMVRAEQGEPGVVSALEARGADVEDAIAYRILTPAAPALLPAGPPDVIALTSTASAFGLVAQLNQLDRAAWFRDASLVCIGPVTARAIAGKGYSVAAVATEATARGLVEAITGIAGRAHV